MNEEMKNENIEQQIPTQEEMPNTLQSDSPQQSSFGPLVGIAIIVILLIVGGVYFWNTTVDKERQENQLPTILPGDQVLEETDAIVDQLNTQGTSDEVVDIETDLSATELDTLDSDLNDLLNEL